MTGLIYKLIPNDLQINPTASVFKAQKHGRLGALQSPKEIAIISNGQDTTGAYTFAFHNKKL